MRIALLNEISQSSKNPLIYETLREEAEAHGHQVFNLGMQSPQEEELSYLHLGVMAFLLLNSGASDFVVTGCGTGMGAMLSLNSYPGVSCGLLGEELDAFLFREINNGNAVSLPFAKSFGWGAEIKLASIFRTLFSSEGGKGYPPERAVPQREYAERLKDLKERIAREPGEIIKALDDEILSVIRRKEAFCSFLRKYGDTYLTECFLGGEE